MIATAMIGCTPRPETTAEHEAVEPKPERQGHAPRSNEGAVAPVAPRRGPTCLPVAKCASFSEPRCARLIFDERGERLEPGPELEFVRAWPGEPGIGESVTSALDYFESQRSCRRRPDLELPPFRCKPLGEACLIEIVPPEG